MKSYCHFTQSDQRNTELDGKGVRTLEQLKGSAARRKSQEVATGLVKACYCILLLAVGSYIHSRWTIPPQFREKHQLRGPIPRTGPRSPQCSGNLVALLRKPIRSLLQRACFLDVLPESMYNPKRSVRLWARVASLSKKAISRRSFL